MNEIKYFICPMSKNIVDSVIELNSLKLGLLPTLRQINYNNGYVDGWNTESFHEYVRKYSNIVLQRDHSGLNQGSDDLYKSFDTDSLLFDIIHIDPWLYYKNMEDGINETIKNIEYIHNINKNIYYEIGTEQSIHEFTLDELEYFFESVLSRLKPEIKNKILYGTIQSGVKIDVFNQKNLVKTNLDNLKSMVELCKKHNLKSKEHNGDFLDFTEIKLRFQNGVDSINIGPELVILENQIYLDFMSKKEIEDTYKICYESNRWKRWLLNMYDIEDKEKMIKVCFHYVRRNLTLPNIDEIVKIKLKEKIKLLLSYV